MPVGIAGIMKFSEHRGDTDRKPQDRLIRKSFAAPLEHLAQDVLKDSAVLVVGDLERRIDAGDGSELFLFALSVRARTLIFFFGSKFWLSPRNRKSQGR